MLIRYRIRGDQTLLVSDSRLVDGLDVHFTYVRTAAIGRWGANTVRNTERAALTDAAQRFGFGDRVAQEDIAEFHQFWHTWDREHAQPQQEAAVELMPPQDEPPEAEPGPFDAPPTQIRLVIDDGAIQRAGLNLMAPKKPRKPQQRVDLDLSKIPEGSRDMRPFKIVYDTMDEARLRLSDSVIMVKAKPFIVAEVTGGNRDVLLHLQDVEGNVGTLPLSCPELDLRSPSPGYIIRNGSSAFLTRQPNNSVYKQGLSRNTAMVKPVGTMSWRHPDSLKNILEGLEGRKIRKWSETYSDIIQEKLISSLMLSEKIAVFNKGKEPSVEFRGRYLGPLKGNDVLLDEDDFEASWIRNALAEVHLLAIRG